MLSLGHEVATSGHRITVEAANPADGWRPPIVRSVAIRDEGIDELVAALDEHLDFLAHSPGAARRQADKLRWLLTHAVRDEVVRRLNDELATVVARIQLGEIDPYTACERLLEKQRSG
jgi:LAO/AO transport system kinase